MHQAQLVIKDQLVCYYTKSAINTFQPTVIFLHGWRSEAKVWTGVLNQLAGLHPNCNFLAIDLPGFGNSPIPLTNWSMAEYANLVNDIIIKLHLSKVILVGHSFGGRTVIKLAGEVYDQAKAKYIIEKIILTGSAGFKDRSAGNNWKRQIAKVVKPVFDLPVINKLKPSIYKYIGADDYNAREDLKKIFVKVVSEDLSQQMSKINLPTLLLFGRNDEPTPVAFGEKMNQLIKNSNLKVIEKAGHFAFLDQSNQWVELTDEFLKYKYEL